MKNFVVRYGVIAGIASLVQGLLNWFFIAKPFGYTASQVVGWLSIILALMCVPLGIKYFRDKLNGGAVSLKQALKIGTGISAIAAIIMFVYSLLFVAIAGNDYKEWQVQGISEMQGPESTVEIPSPWLQGFILFIMAFLIGMIINLISALALKREVGKAIGSNE